MLGCVQRLGRRSAGSLVHGRVQDFSAALLEQELACFATINARFAGSAAAVDTLTRLAWRRRQGQPGPDPELRETIGALAAEALDDGRAAVTRLLRVGVDLAVESIGDELGHCEATLAARFAGVAAAGVAAAEQQAKQLTDTAFTGYLAVEPTALATLDSDLTGQLRLSADRAEPLDTLLARLTRPEPGPGTPGLTGLGIWYRPASAARAAARAAVIGLTNTIREAAMAGMNTAHATQQ